MIKRLLIAITSATAVTLGLLFLMNALSWLQPGALTEPRERLELAWVRVKQDETLKTLPLQQPTRIPNPPELPPTPRTEQQSDGETIEIPSVTAPRPTGGGGTTSLSLGDGPLVALVRVAPNYPARAQANELEGYVIVEFTVLADGTTAEHRVIESSNRIFELSAVRAAERFRYKPKVVDGVPQTTRGVRNVFRFEMDRG